MAPKKPKSKPKPKTQEQRQRQRQRWPNTSAESGFEQGQTHMTRETAFRTQRQKEQAQENTRLEEIKTIKHGLAEITVTDEDRTKISKARNKREAEEELRQQLEQRKQAFVEKRLAAKATKDVVAKYDHSMEIDLPPVVFDDCTTNLEIRQYLKKVTNFHRTVIKKMDAFPRAHSLYFCPSWRDWFNGNSSIQAVVYENIKQHFYTARVYYLPQFIEKSQLPRLLSAVPAICTQRDSLIQLQASFTGPQPDAYDPHRDGPNRPPGTGWLRELDKHSVWTQDSAKSKTFENLSAAINACPRLLTTIERRHSRMKCIASQVDLLATDDYSSEEPMARDPKKIIRNVVVITGVAPQLDLPYLDYADLMFEESSYPSRLERLQHLGKLPTTWAQLMKKKHLEKDFLKLSGKRLFHATGYLQTMKDSFFLWLHAFNDQVRLDRRKRKGYLQIPAMGCDFESLSLPGQARIKNFAKTLKPLLLQALEETLEENHLPCIGKIGLCDSGDGSLFSSGKSLINGVKLVNCPKRHLCKFEAGDDEVYVCGILVPGNSFSLPGNELDRNDSIEADIGINTTMRIVQSYIHNRRLLDPRTHIAVDGPRILPNGQEMTVRIPCIVADQMSTQRYGWMGEEIP